MIRRRTAVAGAVVAAAIAVGVVAATRGAGRVRHPAAAPSSSTAASAPTSAAPSTSEGAVDVTPGRVGDALRAVTGVTPVLAPTAVPDSWAAAVSVVPNGFDVAYRGPAQASVDFSVSIPNPPPAIAPRVGEALVFRGDPAAYYEDWDPSDAASRKMLEWWEPGRWSDPMYADLPRGRSVPYFFNAVGVDSAQFWAIANSLQAVVAPGAGPAVAVIPPTGLADGETVQVVLSGFPPNDRVRLSECASAADATANPAGCGVQPAQQPFLDLDVGGGGSTTFTVHDAAPSKLLDPGPPVACTDGCVLVAADVPVPPVAPLAFAAGGRGAISLEQVAWPDVPYPMTQCETAGGQPDPGVPVEPVALARPPTGAELGIAVVSCRSAADPPTAVFVYDGAASTTAPHLLQTLVTEHDYWVATEPPVVTDRGLSLAVEGYGPDDPASSPSIRAVLTWVWQDGAYRETSPEPGHELSGPA